MFNVNEVFKYIININITYILTIFIMGLFSLISIDSRTTKRNISQAMVTVNSGNFYIDTTTISITNLPLKWSLNRSFSYVAIALVTGVTSGISGGTPGTYVTQTTTTITYSASGLLANTYYYYLIKPYNILNVPAPVVASNNGAYTWASVTAGSVSAADSTTITIAFSGSYKNVGISNTVVSNGNNPAKTSITGTSYNYGGLSANTSYTFYIYPYNQSDVWNYTNYATSSACYTLATYSSASASASASALTVTVSGTYTSFNWRNTSTGTTGSSTSSFTNSSLSANTGYYYTITPINVSGVQSGGSNTSTFYTLATYSSASASSTSNSITVSVGGSYSSFIWRNTSNGASSTSTGSFTDGSLSANSGYYYTITPVNPAGVQSGGSNTSTFYTLATYGGASASSSSSTSSSSSVTPTGSYSTSTSGGYTIYTFTGNGNIAFSSSTSVGILLVGGGGGGGQTSGDEGAGGGGGGAVGYGSPTLSAGTYTVTIGAGGQASTGGNYSNDPTSTNSAGGCGNATTFVCFQTSVNEVAYGGGAGAPGCSHPDGLQGGSGGGGSGCSSYRSGGNPTRGTGTLGLTYLGNSGGGGGHEAGGGGGGGAGGSGGSTTSDNQNYTGAAGGSGFNVNINGINYGTYGGGGGGGAESSGGVGAGGSGGGGNGAVNGSASQAGQANTGGGGGGGGTNSGGGGGAPGGSGILMIAVKPSVVTICSLTVSVSGTFNYFVWRNTSTGTSGTSTGSFTDNNLSPSTNYNYDITPYNAAGTASSTSNTGNFTTKSAGTTSIITVGEGSQCTLSNVISINYAWYCAYGSSSLGGGSDITNYVRGQLSGGNLNFNVNNGMVGDPLPGTYKWMYMEYVHT
jgi:hypothetical protein